MPLIISVAFTGLTSNASPQQGRCPSCAGDQSWMQKCRWKHLYGKTAISTVITQPTVPFLHSQSRWASGYGGSSGLLGIYCKRRGGVTSVALWGLAGIKLSFIFSAPVHHSLKKKKGSSLLQGTGTAEAGAVHQHVLQLPSGNLHGLWKDRSECVNSQHWLSPPKKALLMPGRAVVAPRCPGAAVL